MRDYHFGDAVLAMFLSLIEHTAQQCNETMCELGHQKGPSFLTTGSWKE